MCRSEVYKTVLLSILVYSEEKCANTALRGYDDAPRFFGIVWRYSQPKYKSASHRTVQRLSTPFHAHPTRSEYLGGGIPAFASFIGNASPLDPTAFHSPIGTNIFGPTSGSISCLWLYNSSLALEALIFNQHMTPPATMRKPMMAMMATR